MRKSITPFIFAILAASCIQFSYGQAWQKLGGPSGASIATSIITRELGNIYCYSASGKMFYSTDRGKTWTRRDLGLPGTMATYNTALKESTTGDVFFAKDNEIYRWDPIGSSWIKLTSAIDEIEDFSFSPDGHTLYYGTNSDFYIFNIKTGSSSHQSWWTHSLEFLCLGNHQNFVRRTLGASGEIWKFNDDGSNLRKISDSHCCRNLLFHDSTNTLFDYDNEMFVSKDFGISWTKRKIAPNIYIYKIIPLKDGTLLGIGSNVYRSVDGGINWTLDSNFTLEGLGSNYYRTKFSKADDDAIILDNGYQAYYLETSGKEYALELPLVEPNINYVQQIGQNQILCRSQDNYQLSRDGGQFWQKINLNPNRDLHLWEDGTLMYATNDSLYFSEDLFKTFYTKPLPALLFDNIYKNSQGHLIFLSFDKTFISYDKGDTWNIIEGTSGVASSYGVKLSRQNILYGAYYPDTMIYSLDYGISWNKFSAKGINDSYGITLTQNNVFWWYAYDDNFEYHLMYSTDFGVSTHKFEPATNSTFLYIDEFENIYLQTGGNTSNINMFNILTNETRQISLNGIQRQNNSNVNLYRGDNDTLYATVNHSPLYKYTGKMNAANGLISGNVLIDEKLDCIRDSSENKNGNFQIVLKGNNRSTILPVSPNGEFKSYVSYGTYDMSLQSPSLIWSPCNFPQQINIQPNQTNDYRDLLVQPQEQCADLFSSLVMGRLRRCFDNNWATLKIRNEGSIAAQNTKITLVLDTYFENIHASTNPSSANGNVWTFIIPELKPGKSAIINFQFKISCTASLGQEHCIYYLIDNPQKCMGFLPIGDSIWICDENVGAFDPNDKTAFVGGFSEDQFYSSDTLLQYLIRFQNTGTDTAFNIRIEDKLDYSLDWSTFLPIDASHPYSFNLDESGKLELFFKDIMLPDSNLNEALSHGYFLYSIQPKRNLQVGTHIHNTAGIYFDYNEAVLTNTALLRLKETTRVRDPQSNNKRVLVSTPNPAQNYTDVYIPHEWIYRQLTGSLISTDGRPLQIYQWTDSKLRIERKDHPTGLYYLLLRDEKGNTAYAKIVFE